jgi:nitroimidazol reductase NimA-like FMN-containing flavoprotein (pyridoxamine 5'-phosphate oxidase superfamily)
MRRLASEHIGHLGLSSKALPVVHPIRYRLVGESFVFATASTTELDSARNHAVACIAVSGADASTSEEWTILSIGRLHEVDDPTLTSTGESPWPPAWGTREARRFVALDIELLSGTTSAVARPH